MRISGVTYQGPQERDDDLLTRLPGPLRSLLSQINGFILVGGALHVRGACELPAWHSLKAVPADQRRGFLADFSAKVSKLPEGARISIQVVG